MDADQWIKLFNAIISLILGISWPLVALFLLAYLRVPIKKFIENMGEINLKAGPIETTVKKQTIEAAASLGAAAAVAEINEKSSTNQDLAENKITDTDIAREVASLINQIVTPQTLHKIQGAKILWVDDRPSNNYYEREALSALDIRFVLSNSTEDALEKLGKENFNLIISDMGRPPDAHAGYTLLEKVQKLNRDIPYIIYARGGNSPEYQKEARRKGALASVSGPERLFEKVINALAIYDL
ncbi:response regulator [Dictyobacter sp. S3.2.2.5]|uniref:Response regulator n=1 Tax=Dictyobacter halimunensis TaxID=3026934 RepID=A0ABQ6FUP7_9CHLR|nr:response regulator [Dictyobacter sp. S3.2.2.5]